MKDEMQYLYICPKCLKTRVAALPLASSIRISSAKRIKIAIMEHPQGMFCGNCETPLKDYWEYKLVHKHPMRMTEKCGVIVREEY